MGSNYIRPKFVFHISIARRVTHAYGCIMCINALEASANFDFVILFKQQRPKILISIT